MGKVTHLVSKERLIAGNGCITSDPSAASSGPASRFRKNCALVVGVDKYTHGLQPLRTAVADACAIGEVLADEHGFDVLDPLLNRDAQARGLLTLIESELGPALAEDDRFLIYIAAHGVAIDSIDGPDGYILLHDAAQHERQTYLPMRSLRGAIEALPCRHVLVILDCCFAGSFRWATSRDIAVARTQVSRERYDRYVRSPAWQVLASSAGDQLAADTLSDHGLANDGHSPFASALLDALGGKADANNDGLITATDLYSYVRERVESATEDRRLQSPGLFSLPAHRSGEFVFQVPRGHLELEPAAAFVQKNNPYRGLDTYSKDDHKLFFGRRRVKKTLRAWVDQHSLTVVTGPSGVGKSSLVLAGLVPEVESKILVLDPVRPGRDPKAIASSVNEALETKRPECERTLIVVDQLDDLITQNVPPGDERAFMRQLLAWSAKDGVSVVVTIRADFEPLVRESTDTRWREGRFVVPAMKQDELRQALVGPADALDLYFEPESLVDTIINEVLPGPGALPLLSFAMQQLYLHGAQADRDSRALTEEDYAKTGGVRWALANRANTLLAELRRRDERYELTARRIMLRLVTRAGGELARRRAFEAELEFPGVGERERVRETLNAFKDARLLVGDEHPNANKQVARAEPYVEPAHDELVKGWGQLRRWIKDAEPHQNVLEAVASAARVWDSAQRQSGYLWHGDPRLALVANEGGLRSLLNVIELQFVGSSTTRRRRRRLGVASSVAAVIVALSIATYVTRQSQLEAEHNQVLAEAAQGQAEANEALAMQREIQARRLSEISDNRRESAAARAEASEQPHVAMRGAARAWHSRPRFHLEGPGRDGPLAERAHQASVDAAQTLASVATAREGLIGHRSPHSDTVRALMIDPSYQWLVSASTEGAILWKWPALTPVAQLDPPADDALHAAVSTTGDVAVATANHLFVWSPNEQPMRSLETAGPISALAFHPARNELIYGNGAGRLSRVGITETGLDDSFSIHSPFAALISCIAFSRDGARMYASAFEQDAPIQVWDTRSYSLERRVFRGHTLAAVSIHEIDGGETLVAATEMDEIAIWTNKRTSKPQLISSPAGTISGLAVDPVARRLYTVHGDGSLIAWDLDSRSMLQRQYAHRGGAFSAVVDPERRHVLTGGSDTKIRVWSTNPRHPLEMPVEEGGDFGFDVAFHDGSLVSVGRRGVGKWEGDGTHEVEPIDPDEEMVLLQLCPDAPCALTGRPYQAEQHDLALWSLSENRRIAVLAYDEEFTSSHAVSSGGRYVAVVPPGVSDLLLWRTTDRPATPQHLDVPERGVEVVAFDGDEHLLGASHGGAISEWSSADGRLLKSTSSEDAGKPTSIAVDATLIAVGMLGGDIVIYQRENLEFVTRLREHAGTVTALAFDSAGTWLASAESSGRHASVVLWDRPTLEPVVSVGLPASADPRHLAFDASGERLAIGGDAGVTLLTTSPDRWSEIVSEIAGPENQPVPVQISLDASD